MVAWQKDVWLENITSPLKTGGPNPHGRKNAEARHLYRPQDMHANFAGATCQYFSFEDLGIRIAKTDTPSASQKKILTALADIENNLSEAIDCSGNVRKDLRADPSGDLVKQNIARIQGSLLAKKPAVLRAIDSANSAGDKAVATMISTALSAAEKLITSLSALNFVGIAKNDSAAIAEWTQHNEKLVSAFESLASILCVMVEKRDRSKPEDLVEVLHTGNSAKQAINNSLDGMNEDQTRRAARAFMSVNRLSETLFQGFSANDKKTCFELKLLGTAETIRFVLYIKENKPNLLKDKDLEEFQIIDREISESAVTVARVGLSGSLELSKAKTVEAGSVSGVHSVALRTSGDVFVCGTRPEASERENENVFTIMIRAIKKSVARAAETARLDNIKQIFTDYLARLAKKRIIQNKVELKLTTKRQQFYIALVNLSLKKAGLPTVTSLAQMRKALLESHHGGN